MKIDNIEHVFFDLDHTLWDFDRNSDLAFASIFEVNKITVPLANFLEVYRPINFKYWKYFRENKVTKEQLRYGRFKKSFDALGISIDDVLIDRLSDDYIKYLPNHNFLLEGAQELLEYCASKYQLHIITNGFEEVQETKLIKSGIKKYFKTITTSEGAGAKKPHSAIFDLALRTAGARPDNSVMIGDTFEADIKGALDYGMHALFYDYHKHGFVDKVPTVDHLADLHAYL